jgi:transcriptional regulator GlxA family with amidase domain
MERKIKVGILLFNEVEVLDFAGPFEVFSLAADGDVQLFEVITIGETGDLISARNGLSIKPIVSFNDAPTLDLLIVPGGYGAEEIEIHNAKLIEWIAEQRKQVKVLASVCTGTFLLAKAGLIEGRSVTTHWMDVSRLAKEYPGAKVLSDVKYVDDGDIVSSGGISSGISMSLYLVGRLVSPAIAQATAKRMEYPFPSKPIS